MTDAAAIRVGLGDALFLYGQEYTAMRRLENGSLLVQAAADGDRRLLSDAELAAWLAEGVLRIVPVRSRQVAPSLSTAEFQALPEETKQSARRRKRYLDGLARLGVTKLRHGETENALAKLAEEFGDPSPPSYSTLSRWRRRAGGKPDLGRLADRTWAKGNRTSRLKPEVRAIMDEVIAEHFLTLERTSVTELHFFLRARINRENELRHPHECLTCPSLQTLYVAVNSL